MGCCESGDCQSSVAADHVTVPVLSRVFADAELADRSESPVVETPEAVQKAPCERKRKALSLLDGVASAPGIETIVSFPGEQQEDWNEIVGMAELLRMAGSSDFPFSTACVFLPEGNSLIGKHVANHIDGVKGCFCHRLYNAPKAWGCAWFDVWMQQVETVLERGQKPVVVYKTGEVGEGDSLEWEDLPIAFDSDDRRGLGWSQVGEVAYLKKRLGGANFVKKDAGDLTRELRRKAVHAMKAIFQGSAGGERLADCLNRCAPARAGLRQLVLVGAGIGDAAAAELAFTLPMLAELQELNLGCNALGQAACLQLADALPQCKKLEVVSLRRSDFGASGAEELASALAQCKGLKQLDLSETGWGEDAGRELVRALPLLENLEWLDLYKNHLGAAAEEDLRRGWRDGGRAECNLRL